MTSVRTSADGATGVLTREDAIEALQEYGRLYGPDFTAAAFNPATARWQRRPEYIERYAAGRPDGRPWPALNSIKKLFPTERVPSGSFDEARRCAGFEANKTGPRRAVIPAEEDLPARSVERRVIVRDSEKAQAEVRRRQRAEESAGRWRAAADRERERARDMKREMEKGLRAVTRLQAALDAERARIAELEAQLSDATTNVPTDAPNQAEMSAGLAAEVQRLTERLMMTEATAHELRARLREVETAPVPECVVVSSDTAEIQRLESENARLQRRLSTVEGELETAQQRVETLRAGALTHDLVRRAEQHAQDAVARAEELQRRMREQTAAITGQARLLTSAEVRELVSDGQAGPAVFHDALKTFATARAGRGKVTMSEALLGIARAAMTWRDRLR